MQREVKYLAHGQESHEHKPDLLLIYAATLQKFAAKAFKASLLIHRKSPCRGVDAEERVMDGQTVWDRSIFTELFKTRRGFK